MNERYPEHFLWGAGISAHQTEGISGGGEQSDWYQLEHSRNGDTADIATDFWHRYPEDLDFARSLGLNAFRTSIAWEKVEPSEGRFNPDVLQHYRELLQAVRERGMRPVLTLHHFTNPVWFMERGGWLAPDASDRFLSYATRVLDELGDLCDLWITFNEPIVFLSMSYLQRLTPPRLGSLDGAFEAAFQIARAHRKVTAMIHERQGVASSGGELRGVGLVNAIAIYDPFDDSDEKDREVAKTLSELHNWAFVRAILGEEMKFEIPAEIPGASNFGRAFSREDVQDGKLARIDWLGVNYYMRYLMQYRSDYRVKAEWHTPPGPLSDNGWCIYPEGLERALRDAAERFPGIPLVVTENGLADSADLKRQAFIRDHLAALDRAVLGSDRGGLLDVRGYFHWSLTDNFEWLSGYRYRFGLAAVDYENHLRRIPRPSADVYREEIRKRFRHPSS